MKILLTAINAKYIHSNLAIYCLKSYADKYQEQVELAEFTINQQKDLILKKIYQRKPDVFCVSCYIWNITFVRELAEELHKLLPEMPIWAGGPEVSYCAENFLKQNPAVLGVVCGEGEAAFAALAEYYIEGTGDLNEIPGLVFKKPDEEIVNTGAGRSLDLSRVPFPYKNMEDFSNKIVYYESSRGCPFRCSYCLSSLDKQLRFRDLELVKKELQFFLDKRVPQVKFVDRTFNCKKNHAMEIWRYLAEHDNGVTNFHFEAAADLFDEEELELFSTLRPGLLQLEIGVQTTNPETLKEIHRVTDFDKIAKAVRRIQKGNNIHQHLDLIAGLPYEDYESFRNSFRDVYALHPQQLQLGFLKLLKGSYMQEHAKEYACVHQSREPYEVLSTQWLSYENILQLKLVEEMLEVYYNSGQFEKTLAAVETQYENPFDFYEALGHFCEENGYLGISHTRIRRYEILLEFLESYGKKTPEYYRECMVFDLYARENLKSRPNFAKDERQFRKVQRSFYQNEAEAHSYLKGYAGYDAKQLLRMTHLECFSYDLLNTGEEAKAYWILFDYQNRDVRNHSARCIPVSV